MKNIFFHQRGKEDRPGPDKFLWLLVLLLLFTVRPLPASTGITLLLIGDSLSSGYGLQGPGWVAQTNQSLAEQGYQVNIVNDSISGDTTAGGVARIRDGIDRIKPDWVILELGGNDGLRGLSPREIESNLSKMVSIANESGVKAMLLGIQIPPNYGKTYTERFAKAFENVSEATQSPLLPYFIGSVAGDPGFNQADMIHPNDLAQPLIRDRVLPFIKSVLGI